MQWRNAVGKTTHTRAHVLGGTILVVLLAVFGLRCFVIGVCLCLEVIVKCQTTLRGMNAQCEAHFCNIVLDVLHPLQSRAAIHPCLWLKQHNDIRVIPVEMCARACVLMQGERRGCRRALLFQKGYTVVNYKWCTYVQARGGCLDKGT